MLHHTLYIEMVIEEIGFQLLLGVSATAQCCAHIARRKKYTKKLIIIAMRHEQLRYKRLSLFALSLLLPFFFFYGPRQRERKLNTEQHIRRDKGTVNKSIF